MLNTKFLALTAYTVSGTRYMTKGQYATTVSAMSTDESITWKIIGQRDRR